MPVAIGLLKEITPFNYIFPDGKVPLISIYPCRPNESEPLCFYIDGELLTDIQIEALSFMWLKHNPDKSYEEAYTFIRMGYPIVEEFIRARFTLIHGWYSK
ncbi:hypothetical protein NIES4103_31460 [Nostoc sp. NIES-4103]|nr:hypothetical protein NIES4103_31460 [Nostoc sp. NIES-4103]